MMMMPSPVLDDGTLLAEFDNITTKLNVSLAKSDMGTMLELMLQPWPRIGALGLKRPKGRA
jgi:hypothetical protein